MFAFTMLSLILFLATICHVFSGNEKIPSKVREFIVMNKLPHDDNCFTQGLLYHKSIIIESCGLYGKSSIRKVSALDGSVLSDKKVAKEYFAEGATVFNDMLFMLTWQNRKVVVYDVDTLELKQVVDISTSNGEGWGLTNDLNNLIVSDGTNKLLFFEVIKDVKSGAITLKKSREVTVQESAADGKRTAVQQVNELEYVDGFVFANVWYKDVILKIDPSDGHVVHKYDMAMLYPRHRRISKADCLNGIAYNATSGHFLLTGKQWPEYFVVSLTGAVNRSPLLNQNRLLNLGMQEQPIDL